MRQSVHTTNQDKQPGSQHRQKEQNLFFRPVLQPKLAVNQPDDVYEREADAVADNVMRITEAPVSDTNRNPFFNPPPVIVQKAGMANETPLKKEDTEEESKELLPDVQRKVSFDGMPPPPDDNKTNNGQPVQRKCAQCEEEEHLQRKETNSGATVADASTEQYIGTLDSKGKSLTQPEREFFEPRMGYDFSRVQLHTDEEASQSAKNIHALAYTHDSNIVFGANQYQPGTHEGKKLIAHELAHVVQQSGSVERKSIQRYADECGHDFTYWFTGTINNESEVDHNGVPRVYYSSIPVTKTPAGTKLTGSDGNPLTLVAGTQVDVGQFHKNKYWRAVCIQPPQQTVHQIAWVLNDYISDASAAAKHPVTPAAVPAKKEANILLKQGVDVDLDTNGSFASKELHVTMKSAGKDIQLTFKHAAGTRTQPLSVTPDNITLEGAVFVGAGTTDGIHPLEVWVAGNSVDKSKKYDAYRILITPGSAPGLYSAKGIKKEADIDLTGAQEFDLGVPATYTDGAAPKIIKEQSPHDKQGGIFRFSFKTGPQLDINAILDIIKDPDNENSILCSLSASVSGTDKGIQTNPSIQMRLPIPVSFEELDIENWKETSNSVSYRFLPPYTNNGFMVTYEMNPLVKDTFVSSDAVHRLNVYPISTSTDKVETNVPDVKSGFARKGGEWKYGFEQRTVESFRIESARDAFVKLGDTKLPDNQMADLLNEMSLITMVAVKEKISSAALYSQWMEFAYGVVAYAPDAAKGDDTSKKWLSDKADAFIKLLLSEINGKGDEESAVNANGVGYSGGTITSKVTNKYTGAEADKEKGIGPIAKDYSSQKTTKQPFESARTMMAAGNYVNAVGTLRNSYFLWIEDQLINNTNADEETKKKFQAYGYQMSYNRQLRDRLGKEKTPLQKIKTIYYPDMGNVTDENGRALLVGAGTKGIPLDVYYQDTGDEWVIYNFTTLTQPGKLNDFKRTRSKDGGDFAPPQDMFDLLTNDKGVGTGYIHYQTNIGEGGVVRVDHPWTLGDVLLTAAAVVGLIALALTGVGLLAEGAAAASIGGAAAVLGDIAAITAVAGASVKIAQDYSQGAPVTAARWGELALDVATAALPAVRSLRGIASLRQYKGLFVLMDVAANTKWLTKLDAAANVAAILVATEKGVGELSELSKALAEGRIDEATFYWAVVKNVGLGVINVVLLHSSIKTLSGRALGNTTLEEVVAKGLDKNLLTQKATGMYTKENVEAGIEALLDSSSVYRTMVVEALASENDFKKAIDVVCYLGSKERGALTDVMIVDGKVKRVIDILIEGKFFGKTLPVPQGFAGSPSEKLDDVQRSFPEFSKEVTDRVHGIDGLKDAEVRMQGSATMGIAKPKTPTPENPKTWDYDLAIMVEPAAFNKKLASIFNGKAKYKAKTKGSIDLTTLSDTDLVAMAQRMNADKIKPLAEREFNSEAHTFGNGVVSGKANMGSSYFPELALLKNDIITKYGIPDMDFSVIAANSSFDSTPYITLQSGTK